MSLAIDPHSCLNDFFDRPPLRATVIFQGVAVLLVYPPLDELGKTGAVNACARKLSYVCNYFIINT